MNTKKFTSTKNYKTFLNQEKNNSLIPNLKNIIFCSAISFLPLTSFGQFYNIPKEQQNNYPSLQEHLQKKQSQSGQIFGGSEEIVINKNKDNSKTPFFSKEQIRTLDLLLLNEEYVKFYDYINLLNIENQGIIKYLLSKSNEGHIPTFWLLSNLFSLENDPANTHKWLYVSLIMTSQDAEICTDSTARVAPKTLIRSFPTILDVTNRTPQYIKPGMIEAYNFIKTLRKRTSPNWVCSYGSTRMANDANITYPPDQWNNIRNEKLKNMIQPYLN